MDYVFVAQALQTLVLLIIITYDIACQWMIHFFDRLSEMPTSLQLPIPVSLLFRVPKFHLANHILKCFNPFALNYTFGVGRTDGEGVERIWAVLNKVASSTSMMTMGHRQDTLDDFCNHFNWRRTVQLGRGFLSKGFVKLRHSRILLTS